jgi:23S rRNA pseudouridine2605 synthase
MEERVQKILARAGYGSRRQCEELIQYGRVKVNGQAIQLGAKADAGADSIMVDGKKIKLEEFNFRYIAVNKPRNVLSDCDSYGERKTVHDIVGLSEHLFAVGRLDFDSEGLILMTNDGDLANKLTHPRYGHEKEYQVKVARRPDEKQLTIWRRGVVMEDGYRTAPAIVQVIKGDASSALLKVILKEGRKRQIREIGQLIGLPVLRILRVRIGTLHLGDLKPGAWRDLTAKEVLSLKSSAGTLRQDRKRTPSIYKYKGRSQRESEEKTSGGEAAPKKQAVKKPVSSKFGHSTNRGERPAGHTARSTAPRARRTER